MSGNIEFALISRVIETKDFQALEKSQISADYFTVPEVRSVYEWLRFMYYGQETAGIVPSLDMVQKYFPSFNPVYAPDEVGVLCKAVRDQKMKVELWTLMQHLQLETDKDPYAALSRLRVTAQNLSAMEHVGADLSMSGQYQQIIDRYETVSSSKGMTGIAYPWAPLNEETQGIQPGNYIVLYARPKSMKTWVAIYMAVHAYMKSRRRVLFYTREMPGIQIAMRVASAICGVDYRKFKNGQLDPTLYAMVKATLQMLIHDEQSAGKHGHQPCFVITADRSANGGGVGWLQSKIKEVQPDIVFVDGVYLMKDDRSSQRTADWKNILHISQDLRQTALGLNIPVVAITQANKSSDKIRGDDFTDMAYTDAFNQDADAVFKVKHYMRVDPATSLKHSEIHMYFPGLREGVLDGIVINGVPSTNFEFVRTIVDEEEIEGDDEYGKKKKSSVSAFKRDASDFASTKDPNTKDPKILLPK